MELLNFLRMQKLLMPLLGVGDDSDPSGNDFRSAVLGMVSEIGEVAQMTNTGSRPWASTDDDDLNEELVDIFFFLLEAFALRGLSDGDITRIYKAKFAKNIARIVCRIEGVSEAATEFEDCGFSTKLAPLQFARYFGLAAASDWEAFRNKLSEKTDAVSD